MEGFCSLGAKRKLRFNFLIWIMKQAGDYHFSLNSSSSSWLKEVVILILFDGAWYWTHVWPCVPTSYQTKKQATWCQSRHACHMIHHIIQHWYPIHFQLIHQPYFVLEVSKSNSYKKNGKQPVLPKIKI